MYLVARDLEQMMVVLLLLLLLLLLLPLHLLLVPLLLLRVLLEPLLLPRVLVLVLLLMFLLVHVLMVRAAVQLLPLPEGRVAQPHPSGVEEVSRALRSEEVVRLVGEMQTGVHCDLGCVEGLQRVELSLF